MGQRVPIAGEHYQCEKFDSAAENWVPNQTGEIKHTSGIEV